MNKRFATITLAVLLALCLTTCAFAVPSKSTSDLTSVAGYEVTGTVTTDFTVNIEGDYPRINQELEKLIAFLNETNNAPIEYFGDDVMAMVAELLPGVDLDKLMLLEFVGVELQNYVAEIGDVTMSFTFATPYADGQKIVAVVGVFDEDTVTWYVLEAEVVDGFVKVHFTQELLEKLSNEVFALAILSE